MYFQRVEPLGSGAGGPHFEVLLRYRGDGGEIVLADDFISLAERHGLARECGAMLSINLSGAALADPDFRAFALRTLQACPVPADRICFEISEAAALECLPEATCFMRELKLLGFRFALDDFDGGLNSFARLASLPVDYLKVNGDAAREQAPRAAYFPTVDAVHRVARGLGIATVAKAVEDAAELERLRAAGVEYAQGFLLHAPEPLYA